MFSERRGNDLNIVINGCDQCMFKTYNIDYKRICHFTDNFVTQDDDQNICYENNCPLPLHFKNPQGGHISFFKRDYTNRRE